MISKILAIALAGAMVAGGIQTFRITSLRYEITLLEQELRTRSFQLRGCAGRLNNIITDLESDYEIDNLTPNDLRSVPSEWMLDPLSQGDPGPG
jgi:hypothetical protein